MGIQTFTNLDQYYEDDSQWGNYQYINLPEIVNEFMFSITEGSAVKNVNRQKVVYHAKKAIQELYFDVANEIISLEFDLNPTFIIPLPHDFVQYVVIGWVDSTGGKHPMSIDKRSNLAQAYLQDNDYAFLYDDDGDVLQGSHLQDTDSTGSTITDDFTYSDSMPNYNMDRSKHFKNGSYLLDKERGIIQFSSSVEGKTIFIDYISDGLFQRDDADIRIHKFAEDAVSDFIYWKLIKRDKEIRANDKEGARRDWFNSRRIAKRRITPIRYEEIKQVMKSQTKMIKY